MGMMRGMSVELSQAEIGQRVDTDLQALVTGAQCGCLRIDENSRDKCTDMVTMRTKNIGSQASRPGCGPASLPHPTSPPRRSK